MTITVTHKLSSKTVEYAVLLVSCLISVIGWLVFYSQGLVTAYNDTMAHLNLSRMVVDNMQPGFSQLGGVWLPLNHLLMLPFIWNDWAWRSGFAGSIISMVSFVISSYLLYKIAYKLTNSVYSGILTFLVFA